ncbi:MAG: hypothetical protein ACI841_000596 [Planctomycetota bacterium]|jgi:hypothetical protein
MSQAPDSQALRTTLQAFDERQKKIVGGMITVMIQNPESVRDREWVVEQFTHLVLLAGDFEDVGGSHEGVELVQKYVQTQIDDLLNATFALFQQVAQDMASAESSEQARDRAVAQALSYFL